MDLHFKIKIYCLLIAQILLLIGLNVVIIQGNPVGEIARLYPAYEKFRSSPPGEKAILKLASNLAVVSFNVYPNKDSLRFRKGEAFKTLCQIENTGSEPVTHFRSLIRTPTKEIVSQTTKSLKIGEKLTLKGDFVPEDQGELIIACRADIDKNQIESNELDNREVRTLYISS